MRETELAIHHLLRFKHTLCIILLHHIITAWVDAVSINTS